MELPTESFVASREGMAFAGSWSGSFGVEPCGSKHVHVHLVLRSMKSEFQKAQVFLSPESWPITGNGVLEGLVHV